MIDNEIHQTTLVTEDVFPLQMGQVVEFDYDPSDLTQEQDQKILSREAIGLSLVAASLLIVGFAWSIVFLTERYRILGAIEGVSEIFNSLTGN
jgi:hypothetical protein